MEASGVGSGVDGSPMIPKGGAGCNLVVSIDLRPRRPVALGSRDRPTSPSLREPFVRASIALSVLLLLMACGSPPVEEESPGPEEPKLETEIRLRPVFADLRAGIVLAETTEDLENRFDELNDAIRTELRGATETDWRSHAHSLADLPHEATVVVDALVARWEEVAAAREASDLDELEPIRRLRTDLADHFHDRYYRYVFEEINGSAEPDVPAMTTLMRSCVRLHENATAATRSRWSESARYDPRELLAIVASPDSIRALRERR